MRRLLLIFLSLLASVSARAGEVERLYVIDCGSIHSVDQSVWSPGVGVDLPIDFSNSCYLIRHSSEGYLLWETGFTDRLAALPQGQAFPKLRQTWYLNKPLVATLAAIGVKPADVRYVAVSHMHPDHMGNVDPFPDSTFVVQRREWEAGAAFDASGAAMASPQKPFNLDHKIKLLDGDSDLFGDGSLTILSTPGHTAGHQSLLVHLNKTGYVLLTGDAVHFQSNWDNRRVPGFNADRQLSLDSMDKLARIANEKHAQIWIGHDKPSNDARRHAPEFYE